jgi:hypothetical protein
MPTLGIVGTLVWDRIWYADPGRTEPVEEWGGIGYALEAFEAAAGDWTARPIVKVGRDLYDRAGEFLGRLRTIESRAGVRAVDARNVRVELRYTDRGRRSERLSGALPAWAFAELEPLLGGLDALYVNFIVGNEMELETLAAVRRAFAGPIYGDLHSLSLATGPAGERSLRPLPGGRAWLRAFDVAQMNEDELGTIAAGWGDPWRLAADVVGGSTRVLFVTLGARGTAYFAAPDFEGLGHARPALESGAPVRSGRIACASVEEGDPTGCGDVWGITCFLGLLQGAPLLDAAARANAAAARNVRHLGATGLHRHLRGELQAPER